MPWGTRPGDLDGVPQILLYGRHPGQVYVILVHQALRVRHSSNLAVSSALFSSIAFTSTHRANLLERSIYLNMPGALTPKENDLRLTLRLATTAFIVCGLLLRLPILDNQSLPKNHLTLFQGLETSPNPRDQSIPSQSFPSQDQLFQGILVGRTFKKELKYHTLWNNGAQPIKLVG